MHGVILEPHGVIGSSLHGGLLELLRHGASLHAVRTEASEAGHHSAHGEYRDAQNLQISRSQGSSVGEFENVLGNTQIADLLTGDGAEIIGQFTNEKNNKIYIMSSGYSGAANCPRDKVAYSSVGQAGTTIILATAAGTVIDPQASGIQIGMLLRGDSWNGATPTVAPVVTNVTTTNITIDISITLLALDVITIGFANIIHELDVTTNALKLFSTHYWLEFK